MSGNCFWEHATSFHFVCNLFLYACLCPVLSLVCIFAKISAKISANFFFVEERNGCLKSRKSYQLFGYGIWRHACHIILCSSDEFWCQSCRADMQRIMLSILWLNHANRCRLKPVYRLPTERSISYLNITQ